MSARGYVGVVGPGEASPELEAVAQEVGRLLAGQGVVLVCGGLGGVMGAAVRGCHEAGGTSLGLLPGPDRADAHPLLTLSVPTGLGEMRNALLVRSCDVLIGVGMSWGTLSEVALAARTGVPVVLVGTGTDPEGVDLAEAVPPQRGVVPPIRVSGPQEAVQRALAALPGAVLGVDGAAGGWVGVLLPRTGAGPAVVLRGRDVQTLVREAVGRAGRAEVEVVGIDIPIGLPDTGPRQADVLTRRRLGPRSSSVFPAPVRPALAADTYAEAREISVRVTGGRSLAAQSYALRRAILEVDAYVRSGPDVRVVEVHPELSFALLTGAPLVTRKKERRGATERIGALAAAGIRLPDGLDADTRGVDDVLDAAAAAWSAARVARGEALRLPERSEIFSDGIDAAIWA